MRKFLEFRSLEKKLSNVLGFTEMVKELLSKESLTDVIKIIKSTGVLINQYPGKNNLKPLLESIDAIFSEYSNNKDIELWNHYKKQAIIINPLFQICYQDEDYKIATSLNKEIEIQAFLSVLEISLTTLRSKTETPINVIFKFANSSYSSEVVANEHMFNYISSNAGVILNYLIHYKKWQRKNKDLDIVLTNESLIKSAHHFSVYDKINVLKDMVDYWRYNDCKITQNDEVIKFEPQYKEDYLANDISLKRFETRREKINIEIEHSDITDYSVNQWTSKLPPDQFISKEEVATFLNCKRKTAPTLQTAKERANSFSY